MDKSKRIKSNRELLRAGTEFFVLVERNSQKFLARPINTNKKKSKWAERIFRIQKNKQYSSAGSPSFSIKGHTRLYLACENNDKVTNDRLWARSYEQWWFDFSDDGGYARIRANKNDKYITVFKTDGRSLQTVVADKNKAAEWEIYPVPKCSTSSGAATGAAESSAEAAEVKCWGPDFNGYSPHKKKSRRGDGNKLPPAPPLRGPLLDSDDVLERYPDLVTKARFPLFGSPKKLSSSAPANANDPFDTVLIAERTIRNWAAMDGMAPVMFSDDPATSEIVEKVNREIEENRKKIFKSCGVDAVVQNNNSNDDSSSSSFIPKHLRKHKTLLISSDFEIHSEYKQPTYRGLFKKALELFPDAPGVMYSNGDILFSPTLAQTIRKVVAYFEDQKRENPKLKGWMIVGQRVNYVVPAKFALRDQPNDDVQDGGDDTEKEEIYVSTCSGLNKMIKKQSKINSKYINKKKKNGRRSITTNANDTVMPQWVSDVEEFARTGDLFQGNAEDYFIVSRNMFDWDKIPEFIVGGVAFDNWITGRGVAKALRGEAIMVDAVKTITALHQNDAVELKKSHITPKSRFNLQLAADHGGIHDGYTSDALYATERFLDGSVAIYDKYALLFN